MSARQLASDVQFPPEPQMFGSIWAWVATHPSGQQEEILGFHSPLEAWEWRAGSGLHAWYRSRGYLIEERH